MARHHDSGELHAVQERIRSYIERILESERATMLPKLLCNLGEYVIRQSARLFEYESVDEIDLAAQAARGIAEATLFLHYFTSGPSASLNLLLEFVARDFDDITEGATRFKTTDAHTPLESPRVLQAAGALHQRRSKAPGFAQLARQFGAEEEHRSFYKLYSKFVHPSPYFVFGNRSGDTERQLMKIFADRALVYTREFADRMREVVDALDEPT